MPVLSLTTKAARDTQGGQVRFAVGELDTRRVDLRQGGNLGNDWYFKILAGYQQSGEFAVSRDTSVEYEPELIPLEFIPLPSDRVKTAYGSFRLEKYFGNATALDIEGGTASFEGVTVNTPRSAERGFRPAVQVAASCS